MTLLLNRLAHQLRIPVQKSNNTLHMVMEPAITLFIHQLRKVVGQITGIHISMYS